MFNEIELNELNESKINNYFYLDNDNKIQIKPNLSAHKYIDLLLSFKNSKNVINKILLNLKINNKFSFYIPELLSMNNNEIKEFLLEISNNLKYNLILYWISNNLDFNSKLESSLINDIKINRVNFDKFKLKLYYILNILKLLLKIHLFNYCSLLFIQVCKT